MNGTPLHAKPQSGQVRVVYLDCFAGISGDMLLGALVDAGVPRSVLEEAAAAMRLGASLRFTTVDRSGIAATKVDVLVGDHLAEPLSDSRPGTSVEQQATAQPLTRQKPVQHQHRFGHGPDPAIDEPLEPDTGLHEHGDGRSLSTIRQLIGDSALPNPVKALALRTFTLLGESEARIHNVDVDEIHFHEVGAVDAIVDIVAAAAGLVSLGADAWHCSPVNVGGGMVRCAHGVFPVPAPATADLLRGAPTYSAHVMKELVTPTGAALLRALQPTFGPQPAMVIERIGYGAGTRNPPDFPNVLRLSVGSADVSNAKPATLEAGLHQGAEATTVTVLETAVDDATPQLLAYVCEQALQQGALDVMLTPVIMKKGRPGTLLTVLANPADADRLTQLLLRETTTLGVRVRDDRRVCLDRSHVAVQTTYGTVRVKLGWSDGVVRNATPEFEDCRKLAENTGAPLKDVQAAAMASYLRQSEGPQA